MLTEVEKAPSPERVRLEALLSKQIRAVRDAFREFVETIGSDRVMREVADLLQFGRVTEALDIVDQHIARFSNVIPRAMADAGSAEATALGLQLAKLPGVVAIGFDPSYPRASAILQAARYEFITRFTEQQRESVRQALTRAYTEGKGTVETARSFRQAIGLTAPMEAAVARYRALLEAGSLDALRRALRDRRFDPSVRRAAKPGANPLTAAQIDRMVERYHARALQLRAETISRTEGTRATSQARQEAMRQMMEQAGVAPSRITRVWYPTIDKRTRDAHAAMEGQTVSAFEPFIDGDGNRLRYPGDPEAPAKTTINCRCQEAYRIGAPTDATALPQRVRQGV